MGIVKKSFIESFIDITTGFFLALAVQIFIFPFFNLHPSILDAINISLIFTILSILRSWVFRIYFKRREERKFLQRKKKLWLINVREGI
tara:strand:- start:593 stop:859 length:267 start_codon:yes stop_codon:yes gene_type:complete